MQNLGVPNANTRTKCDVKSDLSHENKDTYSELGKWLKLSFGLHFIDADDVEERFFEEVMAEALLEKRCSLLLLLCCCFTATVNIEGHVGTVS